jgi:excisionase family DNA binding protein
VIGHTIPQAAERVGRSEETIRRWIRTGRLRAVRNPIDRQRYVLESELLDAERAARLAEQATQKVTPL